MATERQPPDALIGSTGFSSCTNSDLTSDPDAGDGNWCVASGNNVDTETHNSYATPTGSPTVGADLQEFKCEVRQFDGGQSGTPDARIELWENGSLVRAGTDTAVTVADPSSQVIAFTWNANELGTADGSLVEIKVIGTRSGGSPTARNTVDVGGVEWNVDFTADLTVNATTDALTLTDLDTIITRDKTISATTDALTLTELQATIQMPLVVTATTDVLTLTDLDSTITINQGIDATTDVLVLTDFAAIISRELHVNTTTDVLTLTDLDANILLPLVVNTTTDVLTLTDLDASVQMAMTINVTTDVLTLTDLDASVTMAMTINATLDALTITPLDATIDGVEGKVLIDGKVTSVINTNGGEKRLYFNGVEYFTY